MPRTLDPIELALLLLAVVVVGSSFEATRTLTMVFLLVILVGLVLNAYPYIHSQVQASLSTTGGP